MRHASLTGLQLLATLEALAIAGLALFLISSHSSAGPIATQTSTFETTVTSTSLVTANSSMADQTFSASSSSTASSSFPSLSCPTSDFPELNLTQSQRALKVAMNSSQYQQEAATHELVFLSSGTNYDFNSTTCSGTTLTTVMVSFTIINQTGGPNDQTFTAYENAAITQVTYAQVTTALGPGGP